MGNSHTRGMLIIHYKMAYIVLKIRKKLPPAQNLFRDMLKKRFQAIMADEKMSQGMPINARLRAHITLLLAS